MWRLEWAAHAQLVHLPRALGIVCARPHRSARKASGGKYTISINTLPTDADGQRQELVRRLAAKDSSIDIIGMDVT